MPEHLLVTPFFHDGELRGLRRQHRARGRDRRHGARLVRRERHRDLPGGAAAAAGQALPRAASRSRTSGGSCSPTTARPTTSWGDLHAMIGVAAASGAARLEALFDEHGADAHRRGDPGALRLLRGWIRRDDRGAARRHVLGRGLPGGRRHRERRYWIRVDVTVDGDHLIVDYSRTDEQALGAINAPYVVTASGDVQRRLLRDRQRRADQRRAPSGRSTSSRRPGRSSTCAIPAPASAARRSCSRGSSS